MPKKNNKSSLSLLMHRLGELEEANKYLKEKEVVKQSGIDNQIAIKGIGRGGNKTILDVFREIPKKPLVNTYPDTPQKLKEFILDYLEPFQSKYFRNDYGNKLMIYISNYGMDSLRNKYDYMKDLETDRRSKPLMNRQSFFMYLMSRDVKKKSAITQ